MCCWENRVLLQNLGGVHYGTKCVFCKPVFLTTLYAKRRGCRDGEGSLGVATDYFPPGALSAAPGNRGTNDCLLPALRDGSLHDVADTVLWE